MHNSIPEALREVALEADWERAHYWPDALLVNGVDIGKERRDRIRAINTARQSREREEEMVPEPTEEDIAALSKELSHGPAS